MLTTHYNNAAAEVEILRGEMSRLVEENRQLRGSPSSAPTPSSRPASTTYQGDHYATPNRPELPPIRSLSNNVANGPDSMTGVQYDNPQSNGYRQERY